LIIVIKFCHGNLDLREVADSEASVLRRTQNIFCLILILELFGVEGQNVKDIPSAFESRKPFEQNQAGLWALT